MPAEAGTTRARLRLCRVGTGMHAKCRPIQTKEMEMSTPTNEQVEADLRDPKMNPPPQTHRTIIGREAPPESEMQGSEVPVPVDGSTGGVVPKDDIPWIIDEKEGPKNP